jgi:hypothetical protein
LCLSVGVSACLPVFVCQVALFASAHPLRCLAGSRAEEEEEVSCGASDGSIYLLRLMLPGDF